MTGAWEGAAFVTELVVSELVTNAIRYGGSPIQLRLIHDRVLICEVSDAGSTVPHMRQAGVFDEGGRGLMLVVQLTQRWGARRTAAGKTIWCEQALPPTGPPTRPAPGDVAAAGAGVVIPAGLAWPGKRRQTGTERMVGRVFRFVQGMV